MANTDELNARMLADFSSIERDIREAYRAAEGRREYEGYEDPYDYLNTLPVEIVQRRTVDVVFTLGGPDIRAVCSAGVVGGMLNLESAELVGTWAGQVRREVQENSTMWQYLDGIVSTMEA